MTTWITRRPDDEVEAEVLAARGTGLPLAGLRLAVKDNIDVAGLPTTAGCPAYSRLPDASAPVVERLVAAGATVMGKTNLDQFATGLVGTRSPYGACESPAAPGRVSGGSSSGSAVAVATGEVDLALGTDTAGSGRVPAALCGIVGIKPTRGWLSTRGVVPACRSIDCVSVFARDLARAAAAVDAAAGWDEADPWSRRPPCTAPGRPVRRLGIPRREVLERWCDPEVADAFGAREWIGFQVIEVDLDPYLEAGRLLYEGAFVAERQAGFGAFVAGHPDDVDPVVRDIVTAAARLPAHALAADIDRLAQLRRRFDAVWDEVDAIVMPTAPSHPTLDDVVADPFGTSATLGRFTNGTNLLDLCGVAVPAGTRTDGLPLGVTVLGPAWTDRAMWAAAGTLIGAPAPPLPPSADVTLAVCGAHLEGEPLHHQLGDRGARLVVRTVTAPRYRMHLLPTEPPKPGLVRVPQGQGASLEVEVWSLDVAAFGSFVAEVPSPLTIGTVELADGSWTKGFLCEAHALAGTADITHQGGWRAWLAKN